MPFELTVNKDEMGSQTAYIHGLGEFPNGTHTISDEQEQNFRIVNSIESAQTDDDPDSETFGSFIIKHELGPPLVEAADNMHGVTVTDKSSGSGKKRSPVEARSSGSPEDNDKSEGGES